MEPLRAWKGRIDSPDDPSQFRIHQVVNQTGTESQKRISLIGLCSDEGIARNHGRLGAKMGPDALRQALGNMSAPAGIGWTDLGNSVCQGNKLENAQNAFSAAASQEVSKANLVIGLGGGHEIALASYRALRDARPASRIGIINFDAHFDLRPSGLPTSGNSFSIALADGTPTKYTVFGISVPSNTVSLFDAAKASGVTYLRDEDLTEQTLPFAVQELDGFLSHMDDLYLTVCLDVLPASVAPGVSAPAARGVPQSVLEPLIAHVARSGKLRIADVAELSPPFDIDERTARVAGRLVWLLAEAWRPN